MKLTSTLLLLIVAAQGCATIHPGEYAVPLDMPGSAGPRTAMGLLISGREIAYVATPSVGAVEVTFENTSSNWIHIGQIGLDFQNEAANQLVTTPPDADAQNWSRAAAQREAIELNNRKNALAGAATAGLVIADAADHGPVAGVAALFGLAALIGLAATEIDEDTSRAERVPFVPENHLLVVPFGIPPGLFVKRWIALTTSAPGLTCLDHFVLSYATTGGQQERVWLRFRSPDRATVWQKAACGNR